MSKTSESVKAIAYHEAGHAIAAWRLVTRVFRVTIERDEDALGSTFNANPLYRAEIDTGDDSPRVQRKAENYMIIALAGHAAQYEYNPRSVRSHHSESDRQAVYEVLHHLYGMNQELIRAYHQVMELRARALIQSSVNWRAIEVLAHELVRERTMSGKSLRQFIISDCFALPPR